MTSKMTWKSRRGQDIGIVTFKYKQQGLILDLLEEQAEKKNILVPESLFVKNIEIMLDLYLFSKVGNVLFPLLYV